LPLSNGTLRTLITSAAAADTPLLTEALAAALLPYIIRFTCIRFDDYAIAADYVTACCHAAMISRRCRYAAAFDAAATLMLSYADAAAITPLRAATCSTANAHTGGNASIRHHAT